MGIEFDNSFAKLPPRMFARLAPVPVSAPSKIVVNTALAAVLGIDLDWVESEGATEVFAGNTVPDGADPLAQLYAGHQFGQWNPQLGDGRAILLGEVVGTDGIRRDIQLKGSGQTPFSRSGDGRSALGPVLREYIVSEAMQALGVPTTRSLAAVMTGDLVYRETPQPGAILTRIAQSHIRVGTFQIHAARGDRDALNALQTLTIDRHFPEAKDPTDLLDGVVIRQASLVAQWMGLGFIHGVMNTDNCSVAGETIDYGPCAFMDTYVPGKVFSSIDQMGRYAYANQPAIAAWNCAQFATSLIPLMPDQEAAIEIFTESVNRFSDAYKTAWRKVFAAKLGLTDPREDDDALIEDLLVQMAQGGSDFTNTFASLSTTDAPDQFADRDAFSRWEKRWIARRDNGFAAIMSQANPQVIPRNHQIEAVIVAALAGDFSKFHEMLAVVTAPFDPLNDTGAAYARSPTQAEAVTRTFCGT